MARRKQDESTRTARGKGEYTAVYERDEDGVWTVEIREAPHCHSYGSSISRARTKIRTALGLWFDDAKRAHIHDDIRLPSSVAAEVAAYRAAREKAEKATAEASRRSREAIRQLRALGLSTRDAAEVTGLSQQRIAQLAS